MKFQPLKQTPALIAFAVIAIVSLLAVARLDLFERLERMTYDWRVRRAAHFPAPVATNLGCVFITNESIQSIGAGLLGKSYGLYWPRHIYGSALQELAAEGARAVAFDVMFTGARADHAPLSISQRQWPDAAAFLSQLHPGSTNFSFEKNGEPLLLVESDDQFAWQLKRSGIGLLAAERNVRPLPLFATNAAGIGDIAADLDGDGVLRRARAFRTYTNWHFLFQAAAAGGYGVDLSKAEARADKIILPRDPEPAIEIPLDAEGQFELSAFIGDELPAGLPRRAKPFTLERVWHMGILLAARELHLNLAEADVDLAAGRIILRGTNGLQRILPVDANGYFYINWEITPEDPRLASASFERVLLDNQQRNQGFTTGLTNFWRDKLVVIGSAATGNDLTDHGATPLREDTLLVSKHWNVANSIITGRFVRPAPLGLQIGLIVLLGAFTACLAQLRVPLGLAGIVLLAVIYSLLCLAAYVQQRLWLPLVLPVGGAVFVQYGLQVAYRALFEQREQRRVKGIFSKVVSPNVTRELLGRESLSLSGERVEVTVMFADVRGFTELTDKRQEEVTDYIQRNHLDDKAAEAAHNESARETLHTVNDYLAIVADIVKKHDGTLDKYIGDCVMAFWGAPAAQPEHALTCVQAAIEAQRAIQKFNAGRTEENRRMAIENAARLSAGLPPQPLLPVLLLGTGINTGMVTVGLMGSNDHILNYTIFGREVNLASRLEGISGHGRIVIGEGTYQALQRDDAKLAAACVELEPARPKGFQKPVRNFEVPW